MRTRSRRAAELLALVLLGGFVACALLEALALGPLLRVLRPSLYGCVPEEIQVLAQSSKSTTLPRRWVALVGDSYAAGLGDWLLGATGDFSPRYQAAHVLHERYGREVISFGQSGVGAERAIRLFVARFDRLNATRRFSLADPETIVVYFYEGNDFDDELAEAIGEEPVAPLDPPPAARPGLADELYLLRFVGSALAAGSPGASEELTRQARSAQFQPGLYQAEIGRRRVPLPGPLQGPALELQPREVDRVLSRFEGVVALLAARFARARTLIAYIPSPLGCYALTSEVAPAQNYHGRTSQAPPSEIRRRSDELAARVGAVAARLGVQFVDTAPAIRSAAAREPVHGPIDWKHFNRAGYEALAEALESALAARPAIRDQPISKDD
jgi:hypothetical protein